MKKFLVIFFLLCCITGILFAGGRSASGSVVELRWLSAQIGESPEAPWLTNTVQRFNAENNGKIRINVDGVAGDAVNDKLRTDTASNTMPDIFMLSADASRFMIIADSGRALDLNPYLAKDPALLSRIDKDSAATYTDKNGKLLGLPYAKAYVGIYYNKDIFNKAGVTEFPKTWADFETACAKILATGVAPTALMTGENSWTTMLLLSNILGTTPQGNQWLKSKPETANYNAPEFISAVQQLQGIIAKYTTRDAIGATYAVAANNFLSGKAAMIANGPWMIGDFSNPSIALPGLDRNVVYALAPGNGVIQMENIAYGSGSKGNKQDAAFEALKFLARDEVYAEFLNASGNAPCITLNTSLLKLDPINAAFLPQALSATMKYTHLANVTKPAVSDGLGQFLPDLAEGKITPAQFGQRLQEISNNN